MDKVVIETVPVTRDKTGVKRWFEERGEFVQAAYGEEIRHLAIFEIRKGYERGGHYHERKEEVFYLFSGEIKATFLDMDRLDPEERILQKGDRIRIRPRCGHIFCAVEDTIVVEHSPQVFDPEDSYPFDLSTLVA